jgi:hypothetical protein
VNSEELENSLRTEFESYLKTIVADTRQEISQLQEKVEIQMEKHKEQLDVVFQEAFAKINSERELDPGFRESVIEHLRLSKDEGARITATAMAEAEKLESEKPVEVKDNSAEISLKFRDAVNEISGMHSQAEILKALVRHAENFASRGAFFIIKNEHFVGWRTFGAQKPENENIVREIFFPTSAATIIGSSVKSNSTETGFNDSFEDNSLYLAKLQYDSPENQTAIPLVVRGRGVAALYVDGSNLNVEALETLVRIAGLTVDLLASSRTSTPKAAPVATVPEIPSFVSEKPADTIEPPVAIEEPLEPYKPVQVFEQPPVVTETFAPVVFPEVENVTEPEFEPETLVSEAPKPEAPIVTFQQDKYKEFEEKTSWDEPKYEIEEFSKSYDSESVAPSNEFLFDSNKVPAVDFNTEPDFGTKETFEFETPKTVDSPFESPAFEVPKTDDFKDFSSDEAISKEDFEPDTKSNDFAIFEPAIAPSFEVESANLAVPKVEFEPVQDIAPVAVITDVAPKPRFSDRNVDLPIDVAEDERRLHNDARRFARLLVSEIKLYNEQKVKDGRDSNDLYERLKEAIDRSREMYDKRVQPPVAAKFDYFHYELVNTLAENEEAKLGVSYPGATV